MPLGIENNGVAAGIIQRGGDYLAKQLVETGQKIETALIRGQAFREARDFGQQLSTVNPASDEFPQAVTALAARYPLAIQSGLGVELMKPSVQAYRGYQQGKQADAIARRQENMAGINQRNWNARQPQPFLPTSGSPRPDVTGLTEQPLNEPAGIMGAVTGPSSFVGRAMMSATGSELPRIPGGPDGNILSTNAGADVDAVKGMSARERQKQISDQVWQDMMTEEGQRKEQGLPPLFNTKNAPQIHERRVSDLFKAETKSATDTASQSLEDFAATNGYERIGQSSYFTKGDGGRYQIDTNAKGQHTVKTAPMTSDPEFQNTAEQRRQAAEERRRADMGLQRAEQKLKLSNVDLDKARRVMDKINSGPSNLAAYSKGANNETLAEGAAAHAFRVDDPEGYKAWKKAVEDLAEAEKKAEEADADYRKSDAAMAKFLEDTAPPEKPATGLRYDPETGSLQPR